MRNRIKTLNIILAMALAILLLIKVSIRTPNEYDNGFQRASELPQTTETWYCSKVNSCNDMDIVLRVITNDVDGTITLDRNMISDSGIGESHLTGTAVERANGTLYAEFVDGEYHINSNGYLVEYFSKSDRWNIYSKDDFTNESLDGNYRSTK